MAALASRGASSGTTGLGTTGLGTSLVVTSAPALVLGVLTVRAAGRAGPA